MSPDVLAQRSELVTYLILRGMPESDRDGCYARIDAIIAAVRAETLAGSGVRTVQAKEPPSGVDSHMAGWVRWDKPMDPITRLLANLDYESYEVDAVGGGKVRCWKFSEWPDALRRAVGAIRALAATPPTPALTAARLAEAMRESRWTFLPNDPDSFASAILAALATSPEEATR